MKLRIKLLIAIALLCCLPVLAGAAADNLLAYTDFETDSSGNILGWEQTGAGAFTVRDDAERGKVVQIKLSENGASGLQQILPVYPNTAYCVRFDARVLDFSGYDGAYVEVPGVPNAFSYKTISSEWQTIELYGYTSDEQEEVVLSFNLGSYENGDIGTAEFANIEVFIPDTVPRNESEGKYVFFYDTSLENTGEQTAPNDGSSPALVLGLAYAIVIMVLNSYGAFKPKPLGQKDNSKRIIWMIIIGSTLLRMVAAFTIYGHETDVNDFSIWATDLNRVGIGNFYTSDIWCDYPPGYLYILYIIGFIANTLGLAVGSTGMVFLIKLPAIICDAITVYLIFRIARKYLSDGVSLLLAGLYAFNFMVIYDSAFWGQIDSVFMLFVLLVFWFYQTERKELAAVCFFIGLMVKPQMLILGPVVLFAYIKDIIHGDTKKELLILLRSALAMAAVAAVIILPFSRNQSDPLWLPKLMGSTTSQYKYASINAYNLYTLVGANWVDYSNASAIGISYKTLGDVAIVVVSALAGLIVFRNKDRKAIIPAGLFMVWGIFTLSHSMHERYLYPVMALSLLCYMLYRDKRYIYLFGISTFVLLTNCVVSLNNIHLMGFEPIIIFIAAVNMLGFGLCAYVCFTPNALLGKQQKDEDQPDGPPEGLQSLPGIPDFVRVVKRQGEKMLRMDYIVMLAITAIYAIVALTNLGSTKVPGSYWRTHNPGESMVVELKRQTAIDSAYFYSGVGKGEVTIQLIPEGDDYPPTSLSFTIEEGEMYTWQTKTLPGTAKRIIISAVDAGVFINEMAFYDQDGNMVEIESVSPTGDFQNAGDVAALFDEQHLVDKSPTFMKEMYFDEIYHARTAFEHLNGMPPYENTHPPLGKVFIMLGIWIFGMNPFGWRIVGTLFGIAMLPLLYIFAKRIFKDTKYAALATALFALDGMHFVQTRIATIDVYGVFFIMAMCYFMYRYWQMNFFVDNLKETFVPLGLSGIMFGLGAASKWIGFYAGAGLAVALFTTFGFRYIEYRKAKRALETGSDIALLRKMVDSYWHNVLLTCLFCVGFFIAIPLVIYILSYLPYFLCAESPYGLKGVLDIQSYMFNYHSGLTATHYYQSIWWEWPLIVRPIWYYFGHSVPEGMISTMAAFGNPGVWWVGSICAIACGVLMITRDKKIDRGSTGAILIFLGGALLPWIFITRATFIYHFFASVPFIILLTVMCAKRLEKNGKMHKGVYVLAAVCFALFVLFYPVWSGTPINREYAFTYLQWFSSWEFFGSMM